MTDAEQVKNAFGAVKIVNDPVIAHSDSVGVHSLHSMMRVAFQRHAQTINAGLDSGLNGSRKFEEVGVEIPRVDLERGAHPPFSGLRTREYTPSAISC